MNTSEDLLYQVKITISQIAEIPLVNQWLTEEFGIELSKANIEGIWSFFTYSTLTFRQPDLLELTTGFLHEEDAMAFKLRWL